MKKLSPPPIGRYIDPLSDFGFKLLFGSEPNKELLIAFLNELFKGKKQITDLYYNKNEYQGPQAGFRRSIFDLTCTGNSGEQFVIEVQRVSQPFFKDRAIYYTSTLIHDQGLKGKKNWDFKLKEVYLVGLMDFTFDDSSPETCLHCVHLSDEATGAVFYKKLGYIFIELPKFSKGETELKTDLDRWLYVLKNMSLLQKIPVILNKRIFEKLFAIAEISNLTKEEYMRYERSRMAQWDEYAIKVSAPKYAREEGRKEGIEMAKQEVIQNLLAKDQFTITEIANIVNVSEVFVHKVKKNIK
jgi:predicted transposase/invertase (TIGR01784 family)